MPCINKIILNATCKVETMRNSETPTIEIETVLLLIVSSPYPLSFHCSYMLLISHLLWSTPHQWSGVCICWYPILPLNNLYKRLPHFPNAILSFPSSLGELKYTCRITSGPFAPSSSRTRRLSCLRQMLCPRLTLLPKHMWTIFTNLACWNPGSDRSRVGGEGRAGLMIISKSIWNSDA